MAWNAGSFESAGRALPAGAGGDFLVSSIERDPRELDHTNT
jgi:hypothetical protein